MHTLLDRRLRVLIIVVALVAGACTGERPSLVAISPEDQAGLDEVAAQEPGGSPVVGDAQAQGLNDVPGADTQAQPGADAAMGTSDGGVDSPSEAPSQNTDGCLSDRQWIGQTMMPLVTPEEFGGLEPLAAAGEVGGLVMLGTPPADSADLAARLGALDNAGPVSLLMASDEEGGLVQRLAPLLGELPSAEQQVATMSPPEVQQMFSEYGQKMKDLGFDIAFAPVVDLGGGPGIGTRSYGTDPAVVIEYARAVADGYSASGVLPVYKHFPGHGRASADSHVSLPTTPPYSELLGSDLVPYDTLLSGPQSAVMVGHLSVPGLSDETPTSLSPMTVSTLLRGEGGATVNGKSYNFGGLVFSDAMNMGAVTAAYSVADIAIESLRIGTDVVLIGAPADAVTGVDAVQAAIGNRLEWAQIDDSVQRILALKGRSDLVRCSAG